MKKLILAGLIVLGLSGHTTALEVTGQARVIDGDTLNLEGISVRLHGIDAPESAQRCRDERGHDYACGERAAARLRSLVGTSPVTCEGREFDQYRRLIAVCRSGVTELNHAMVVEGHAWAFVRFSEDYIAAEHEARSAKRGVFAANNQPPGIFV